MKKQRFTEEQIIPVLKEYEVDAKIADLCRSTGFQTLRFITGKPNTGQGSIRGEAVEGAGRGEYPTERINDLNKAVL